ncbi:MAG: hypothetical protein II681_02985 [Bacteroidaceae bacterium]|jgi:hypothetical protein|nr:hypothetical protein [Bacteroidaceae bacterium]MBQ2595045.1 hypothetical protein [Bacteroidaceae bacterium]MBQ3957801.1 hypothetical protein [Bacteroidaceae bacterium]MBQ3992513.1 hypothetical protein [Bacteroidaceae bacterium]MBQ4002687.1 hypothetical protein [Bacteroidaceae bacterium]
MFALILAFTIAADTLRTDTARLDTTGLRADTLRQVEVRADTSLAVEKAIQQSLERQRVIRIPTLGDILDKYLPGLQDRITHPFAIKERKRERKHKRDKKWLQEFDRRITFNELLDAAVKQQQLEDEAARRKTEIPND